MKKIFNIIITVALAATIMHTCDMLAGANRSYQRGRSSSRSAALQRKGRRSPQARPARQQRRVAPLKDPVTRKQETEINQQVKQNTQALENAVKQKEKAKTPEEKAIADKNVHELAQELLADLKNERTFISDVYSGYGAEQIKKARSILTEKLYPIQRKVLDALSKKENALALVTDKGFIWDDAKKGKEKEYNDLLAEVTKLKNTLNKVENAVYNNEVIAGKEWAKAYYALLAAGALGSAAAIGNVLVYGGAGMVGKAAVAAGSGLSSIPGWLKEKTGGTWEWGTLAAKYGMKAASGLFFLYNSWNQAKNAYLVTLSVYNAAFKADEKKNPTATPEQRAANLAAEKAELDKAEANLNAKKAQYDAALKQADAQKNKK